MWISKDELKFYGEATVAKRQMQFPAESHVWNEMQKMERKIWWS